MGESNFASSIVKVRYLHFFSEMHWEIFTLGYTDCGLYIQKKTYLVAIRNMMTSPLYWSGNSIFFLV
jgi:hypothetical protein